jgi:hypothetical protein
MHRAMFQALKPGGLLIMQMFTPEQLNYESGGPPVLDMLYTPAMLRQDFDQANILHLEEALASLDEGPYHQGSGAVVNLLLERPAE